MGGPLATPAVKGKVGVLSLDPEKLHCQWTLGADTIDISLKQVGRVAKKGANIKIVSGNELIGPGHMMQFLGADGKPSVEVRQQAVRLILDIRKQYHQQSMALKNPQIKD